MPFRAFCPPQTGRNEAKITVLLIISTPFAEKTTKHTVNPSTTLDTQTNRWKFERESEPQIGLSETLLRSRVTGTRAKKDAEFQWGPKRASAFQKLKNELARAEILGYYDKDAETAKRTRGQTEREALAIVWANVFTHTYMGSSFTL